ncbi:hypothetical protein QVD17_15941 [Tagetes erecta]|uniref:Uncharacterized protein n=1 Tax=Tagetes erecta TaxID=13708 RepID=A0AAD8KQT0_TARER|nr:hypothetical protein QVD17_15941 [Tagetes erecta]
MALKTIRVSTGVLNSIATTIIRCAKQAFTLSKNKPKNASNKPKKLVSSISNKAVKLCHCKKREENEETDGVWRREILMGDKCQPLDFSGVIYYDKDGNLLTELPMRSPRASPLLGWQLKH